VRNQIMELGVPEEQLTKSLRKCKRQLKSSGDSHKGCSPVIERIAQRGLEPFDCRVKAMFKIHVSVGGPEFPAKLFARNQLTGAFEKADQNLDRLPLQPDFAALLPNSPERKSSSKSPNRKVRGVGTAGNIVLQTGFPEFNIDADRRIERNREFRGRVVSANR
jgi:hypothetical protein